MNNHKNNNQVINWPQNQIVFNRENIELLLLARFGFSAKLISEKTGFSKGRISYRLKKGDIRLKDYRDGKTKLSKLVINGSERFAINQLREHVRAELSKQFKSLGYNVQT